MLIGIDFADNDFNMTVRAFLKLFTSSGLIEWYPQNATKANICRIWNESFHGIYWAAQNGFAYEDTEEHKAHLKKVLELKEKHVYLGQECLDRIVKNNNYEFTYIDTEKEEIFTS